jgi:hypothetical protein
LPIILCSGLLHKIRCFFSVSDLDFILKSVFVSPEEFLQQQQGRHGRRKILQKRKKIRINKSWKSILRKLLPLSADAVLLLMKLLTKIKNCSANAALLLACRVMALVRYLRPIINQQQEAGEVLHLDKSEGEQHRAGPITPNLWL